MEIDNKIKQLKKTFDIRIEITDMMWEIDRLIELEISYINEEKYEKANIVLNQQKRLKKLIKNKEKNLITLKNG